MNRGRQDAQYLLMVGRQQARAEPGRRLSPLASPPAAARSEAAAPSRQHNARSDPTAAAAAAAGEAVGVSEPAGAALQESGVCRRAALASACADCRAGLCWAGLTARAA